jgi:hypothetical protein
MHGATHGRAAGMKAWARSHVPWPRVASRAAIGSRLPAGRGTPRAGRTDLESIRQCNRAAPGGDNAASPPSSFRRFWVRSRPPGF